MNITDVQKQLAESGIDGWLLYDFHGSNHLALEFLQLPEGQMATRRLFYFIPVKGEPVALVHAIEEHLLDHLPGEKRLYLKWQKLEEQLSFLVKGKAKIAMEYSPRCAIPTVATVDAGTVELIRSFGPEIVSSGPLLQRYTSVWDEKQLESHYFAARVLDQTAEGAWRWIGEALRQNRAITEFDVSQWMLGEFERAGCWTDYAPICAVGACSAMPHYAPTKKSAAPIKKGDFILIDLWCKKKGAECVFADITRVGVAANRPSDEQEQIFSIVSRAQRAAKEFVQRRHLAGERVLGCEVDRVCRQVIEEAGFGDFFLHRTGHNIHTQVHGPGANLDSLETLDSRPLLEMSAYSVEPGIYLPQKFGVRLECDLLLLQGGRVEVTGGIQEEITLVPC
jgi:Xaa-Pro dipeptidase